MIDKEKCLPDEKLDYVSGGKRGVVYAGLTYSDDFNRLYDLLYGWKEGDQFNGRDIYKDLSKYGVKAEISISDDDNNTYEINGKSTTIGEVLQHIQKIKSNPT